MAQEPKYELFPLLALLVCAVIFVVVVPNILEWLRSPIGTIREMAGSQKPTYALLSKGADDSTNTMQHGPYSGSWSFKNGERRIFTCSSIFGLISGCWRCGGQRLSIQMTMICICHAPVLNPCVVDGGGHVLMQRSTPPN